MKQQMKKLLFLGMSLTLSVPAFALTTVNLDTTNYSCGTLKLTSTTPESSIVASCKNVHTKSDTQITSGQNAGHLRGSDQIFEDDTDPTVAALTKIRFTSDDGNILQCYYRNSKLVKCKHKALKAGQQKTSGSAPQSNTTQG